MDRREHHAKFPGALLLELLEDRVAVEGRKIDIEEQERRLRRAAGVQRLEQIQGFTAVAKVQKLVPARLETERQQIGECGVVLDDYYFRYIARFRLWGGGGRRGGGLVS